LRTTVHLFANGTQTGLLDLQATRITNDMAAKIAKIGLEYLLLGLEPEPAPVAPTPGRRPRGAPAEEPPVAQDLAQAIASDPEAPHVH